MMPALPLGQSGGPDGEAWDYVAAPPPLLVNLGCHGAVTGQFGTPLIASLMVLAGAGLACWYLVGMVQNWRCWSAVGVGDHWKALWVVFYLVLTFYGPIAWSVG